MARAPDPPISRSDPPAGAPPGPAPGLRATQQCVPLGTANPTAAPEPDPAEWAVRRLQLSVVHTLATGAGQRIAVIDTGISPHPRLIGRLRGIGDFLTGGDGLDDCDGHGTAVAGLLGAAPDPGDGFVGIAPAAELLAIRQSSPSFTVPGPDGRAHPAGDTDTLGEAIVLAVREGAGVLNISEAACLPAATAAEAGAGLQAALRYAADADVVVIAAAGNIGVGGCAEPGGEQVSLPGWYDADVLTVAAVGPDDAAAEFTVAGPWVDLGAPGVAVRSLAVGGGLAGEAAHGTSFAAPWVAGLAALLRERFPGLSAAEVTDRILATTRRPAAGHNDTVGLGVVDPLAALTAEPLLLRPGTPVEGYPPTAPLPGTAPVPPPAAAAAWATAWAATLPPAGVALLLVAAALASRSVRKQPAHSSRPAADPARRPPDRHR